VKDDPPGYKYPSSNLFATKQPLSVDNPVFRHFVLLSHPENCVLGRQKIEFIQGAIPFNQNYFAPKTRLPPPAKRAAYNDRSLPYLAHSRYEQSEFLGRDK